MRISKETLINLKLLIGKNKIELALEKLIDLLQNEDPTFFNQVILKLQQWNQLKASNGIELSDYSRIIYYLLETIDEIEKAFVDHTAKEFLTENIELRATLIRPIINALEIDNYSTDINHEYLKNNQHNIKHLLELMEIHARNLRAAEKALAEWGNLAPPILLSQENTSRIALEDTKGKLAGYFQQISK